MDGGVLEGCGFDAHSGFCQMLDVGCLCGLWREKKLKGEGIENEGSGHAAHKPRCGSMQTTLDAVRGWG